MKRILDRGNWNRFDIENIDFHLRVREGYKKHIKEYPHFIINGDRTREFIAEEFKELVNFILKD